MDEYSKLTANLTELIRGLVPVVLAEAIRDGQVQVVNLPAVRLTLTAKEVAGMLGVPVSTLAEWRKQSKGPAWSKPGKVVLYPREAVEEYLRAVTIIPRQPSAPSSACRR
jgi:DNA binding domain, excisionase family